jgi:hypothetical protein
MRRSCAGSPALPSSPSSESRITGKPAGPARGLLKNKLQKTVSDLETGIGASDGCTVENASATRSCAGSTRLPGRTIDD